MRQQSRHLPAFILLLVAEQPLHGGAIQTQLGERLPRLKADSGAVYRALQRLEQDGEVEAFWDTSRTGPARKVYRLREAGWEKLDFWRQDIQSRLSNLSYFLDTYQRLRKDRIQGT